MNEKVMIIIGLYMLGCVVDVTWAMSHIHSDFGEKLNVIFEKSPLPRSVMCVILILVLFVGSILWPIEIIWMPVSKLVNRKEKGASE